MGYKNQFFTEQELQGQEYEQESFQRCQFGGVDLKFTSFLDCTFEECDFTGALLDATNFTRCHFPHSKLSYLDFSPASFQDCDFSTCIMQESIWQTFKTGSTTERKKLDLRGSNFSHAELAGTVFTFCDLQKISFHSADLTRVIFERCELAESDLTGANLNGTTFSDSKIQKTKLDIDGFLQLGMNQGFVLSEEK